MLGKILIFVLIAGAVLVIFGRGARRGEDKVRRDGAPADPIEKARSKVKAARAEDLSPCPKCGAYVADPEKCDCRAGKDAGRADMQQ